MMRHPGTRPGCDQDVRHEPSRARHGWCDQPMERQHFVRQTPAPQPFAVAPAAPPACCTRQSGQPPATFPHSLSHSPPPIFILPARPTPPSSLPLSPSYASPSALPHPPRPHPQRHHPPPQEACRPAPPTARSGSASPLLLYYLRPRPPPFPPTVRRGRPPAHRSSVVQSTASAATSEVSGAAAFPTPWDDAAPSHPVHACMYTGRHRPLGSPSHATPVIAPPSLRTAQLQTLHYP